MSSDRPSRQTRRREHKALLEEGRKAIRQGLPNPVPQAALIGIGLVLEEPLGKPAGASTAAGLAIRLATATIDKIAARDEPACRKGCDHCCHFAVSATAPEIFHVARALASADAAGAQIRDRIVARQRETSGMRLDALMAQCLPCPLLSEGECGLYSARPIVCRQFMSRAVEPCAEARTGQTVEIPVLRGAINAGALTRNLLLAAVRARGLDERCYELSSALAVALAAPEAERQWLAGQDVFAQAIVVPRAAEATAVVARLASEISAYAG